MNNTIDRRKQALNLINLAMSQRKSFTPNINIPNHTYLPKLNDAKDIQIYDVISEGNGKPYTTHIDNINLTQEQCLKYQHNQILIQIFIELRNALGFTSYLPHCYRMDELKHAIHIFQIEYAMKYGIKFNYGYKIIKANPLFSSENARDYTELVKERNTELHNEPAYIDDSYNYSSITSEQCINITDDPIDLILEAEQDAFKVTSLSQIRLYDNDYVSRRKKGPRRLIIHEDPVFG